MSSPTWLLTAALVFTPACAVSPASLNPTPALGRTGEFLRSEDSSQGIVSLWIAPMQVRSVHLAGAEASCVLQIGAVYSAGVGVPAGGHFVGLTLTFTYDAPILQRDRGLTLDVDGLLLKSVPSGDPRFYSLRRTPAGIQETVIIPIARHNLVRVSQARRVRARLGQWITFGIDEAFQIELRRLIEEIPGSVARRRAIRSRPLTTPPETSP